MAWLQRPTFTSHVYFGRRIALPTMIPFLHIGQLSIPTFGLMVAAGLLVAAYLLQADFDRRRPLLQKRGVLKPNEDKKPAPHDEGFLIIGIAGLAGLVGARLYHVLESPEELIADPSVLVSRFGFAWFGGFIGGFLALLFLARHFQIPVLEFMDMCSPAAAVGYGIGRIGCFLSGDGDYGKPTSWPWPWGMAFPKGVVPTTQTCVEQGWPADCRVYPTPIYELIVWMLIAAVLWRLGKKAVTGSGSGGEVFSAYLILTGLARFLIEIIRINPRSFFGMSNAQTASVVSIVIGLVLAWRLRSNPPTSA